jgi:AcrR family transcriptional regulator
VAAAAEPTAPSAPRGRPRSAAADQAIAQAAIASLIEDGYAGLTMAGVAHRAGVSTATLYRRFHDKDELVIASLEHFSERRAPVDTGSLLGDLRAVLSRIGEALAGDGGRILEGLMSETLRNRDLGERIRSRLVPGQHDQLRAILDRAYGRGELPCEVDVDLAESIIAGPLYHRMLIAVRPVTTDVIESLVPVLARALGAEVD